MNESEQSSSSNAPVGEGGSPSGEGRGRRRRRRGRRGEGRAEGQSQDATGTQERDDDGDSDAGTDTPAPAPAQAGGRAEGDGDRKKKRRKKKRGGEPAADGAEPKDGEQKDAEQRDGQAREKQGDKQGDKQADKQGKKGPEKKERAPRGSVLQRRVNRGEYNDAPKVKDEPIAPPAPVNAVNVEGYVNHHKGWQREVLSTLHAIVKGAGGDIEESILWSQPVFTSNGPVCYMKAFSDHVNFGFWRGTELDDPNGLLVGDLTKMRHITIRNVNDVKREVFEGMVRQAVRLNREKGDPTLS